MLKHTSSQHAYWLESFAIRYKLTTPDNASVTEERLRSREDNG